MSAGIYVLGMHRSGTSMITRLVNLLGVQLGVEDDLMPEAADNPKGFWESVRLADFNDRLLKLRGGSWCAPPKHVADWEREPAFAALYEEARETFRAVYRTSRWLWKDPRCSLTLPFWLRALDDRAIVVFVYRDPLEVALSLQARDGFAVEEGVALWERYVRHGLIAARGLPVFVTSYEEALVDPLLWSSRVETFLHSNGLRLEPGPNAWAEIEAFVEPALRHGCADGLAPDERVAHVAQLYQSLHALRGAHAAFDLADLVAVEASTALPIETADREAVSVAEPVGEVLSVAEVESDFDEAALATIPEDATASGGGLRILAFGDELVADDWLLEELPRDGSVRLVVYEPDAEVDEAVARIEPLLARRGLLDHPTVDVDMLVVPGGSEDRLAGSLDGVLTRRVHDGPIGRLPQYGAAAAPVVEMVRLHALPRPNPRDIEDETVRALLPRVERPDLLFELIELGRDELGFFPNTTSRVIEYPRFLAVADTLPRRASVVDLGAGVSPLPLALAARGLAVTTVDPHRLVRTDADKEQWTEWGFLDYSSIDPRISSIHAPFEQAALPAQDAIFSVSVIEHIPAAIRRELLHHAAQVLAPSGLLFASIDLVAGTDDLWNLNEGVPADEPWEHGTIADVVRELEAAGFAVDPPELCRDIPGSRTDIAYFRARR